VAVTDTIGRRAPGGHSYTYLVMLHGADSSPSTLVVTMVLPPELRSSGAFGDQWACSNGRRVVTCTWAGAALFGENPFPISVPVTVDPDAPPGAVLTATAALTSGDVFVAGSSLSASDTVTVTRRHH
jgi:hypothetical protein